MLLISIDILRVSNLKPKESKNLTKELVNKINIMH